MEKDGIVDGYYHPHSKKPINLKIPFAYYKGQEILSDLTKKYIPNFAAGTQIDFRVLIVDPVNKKGYYSIVTEFF